MNLHHQVLIIGGGTAGIMVASQLRRKNKEIEIGIIEPSEHHYYQAAWTLVGANAYKFKDTVRPMIELIPENVNWIKDYAETFVPEQNQVITKSGTIFTYDYLVVAPGLKIAPELIEGLEEALEKGIVCSNYIDPEQTWETLKNFKGGTALFSQPTTPIKCGGAPQKIMYMAEEHFKNSGVRDKTNIVYALPSSAIFGVKKIANTLMGVIKRKDINVRFFHKLIEIDVENKIAYYEIGKKVSANKTVVLLDGDKASVDNDIHINYKDVKVTKKGDLYGIHFDMMHLAPPQSAPDFIRNSLLVDNLGWVSVNPKTTQHIKYANVFSLGDVSNLPTSKTGAAIRKQAPVTVAHILAMIKSNSLSEKEYDGYTSCPLVTGYGKMVLAEFDYDKNFKPDPLLKKFPFFIKDSSKEHWRLWILKKYGLPYLYWKKMMKGIEF